MKTWNIPTAVAQRFAANDSVSACYNVLCVTPLNNAQFGMIVDASGEVVYDPKPDGQTWLRGCGGTHEVEIIGDLPTVNGYVTAFKDNPEMPVFYWFGDVIGDPTLDEDAEKLISDLHVTDLGRSDAITESNKS